MYFDWSDGNLIPWESITGNNSVEYVASFGRDGLKQQGYNDTENVAVAVEYPERLELDGNVINVKFNFNWAANEILTGTVYPVMEVNGINGYGFQFYRNPYALTNISVSILKISEGSATYLASGEVAVSTDTVIAGLIRDDRTGDLELIWNGVSILTANDSDVFNADGCLIQRHCNWNTPIYYDYLEVPPYTSDVPGILSVPFKSDCPARLCIQSYIQDCQAYMEVIRRLGQGSCNALLKVTGSGLTYIKDVDCPASIELVGGAWDVPARMYIGALVGAIQLKGKVKYAPNRLPGAVPPKPKISIEIGGISV